MELFTPDFGLIFWMFVAFGVLFLILWKFAWPVILKSVDSVEGDGAHTAAQSFLCLFLLLHDGGLGGIHHFLRFCLRSRAGFVDNLRLQSVCFTEHVGLATLRALDELIGALLGMVELLLGILRILHAFIDKVCPAVDTFQDDGPGELPQYEEEYAKLCSVF